MAEEKKEPIERKEDGSVKGIFTMGDDLKDKGNKENKEK